MEGDQNMEGETWRLQHEYKNVEIGTQREKHGNGTRKKKYEHWNTERDRHTGKEMWILIHRRRNVVLEHRRRIEHRWENVKFGLQEKIGKKMNLRH